MGILTDLHKLRSYRQAVLVSRSQSQVCKSAEDLNRIGKIYIFVQTQKLRMLKQNNLAVICILRFSKYDVV